MSAERGDSPETMRLRAHGPDDAEELAEVYRDAARTFGPLAYTEEQTRVWALHPEDLGAFRAALAKGRTLRAVAADRPVAFGQHHSADHVAYLYCRSAYVRRGWGSAILARLEAHAAWEKEVAAVRVEASAVARPFFERFGYRVVAEERPLRHGVEMLRFRMRKRLSSPPAEGSGG